MPTHAERISYLTKLLVFPSSQQFNSNAEMYFKLFAILTIVCCAHAAPKDIQIERNNEIVSSQLRLQEKDDLKTAATSYTHQYSDWGGSSPGGYGYSVTGFGVADGKYGSSYDGISGYDNSYPNGRYPGSQGYYGNTGYVSNPGYPSTTGLDGSKGYGYNPTGLEGNAGYGGYGGNGGYGGYGGNGGYGGYGGNGGNGGLSSYSGYNNPYYQESNHLGYGYYNKRSGFGNIYNSGITPNSVTGYRGYSRR